MSPTQLNLDGYTDVPAGHVASIVTYLEMPQPPRLEPAPELAGAALARLTGRDEPRYAAIYRRLGERWMWFSRLALSPAERAAILDDKRVEACAVTLDGREAGLLELDFRVEGEVELAFLGLVDDAVGTGAGRWLIQHALAAAWARPGIARLWVHTCTLDHPRALEFYRRAGFMPYKIAIEIAPDPRLCALFPRDAAPHVPIVEGRPLSRRENVASNM